MKNVLITGGAGNIGSKLAEQLDSEGFKVVVVDNLLTGKKENLHNSSKVKFITLDVNNLQDLQKVFETFNFEYVFHYAAVVGVQRTLENPLQVLGDAEGIQNILKLSVQHKIKRVFYSSSSEIYGEPFEVPQNEDTTPLNSRLPYAIIKNLGEAYFKTFWDRYELQFTIFRFFNTYGPNQSDEFVVPNFLKRALKNEDIIINGDGLQTRTFMYVKDNVDICSRILSEDLFVNDVVNIGSEIQYTIKELAILVKEITGSSSKIVHVNPLAEGDMTRRCPDISKISKIKSDLIPLEKGLELMVSAIIC